MTETELTLYLPCGKPLKKNEKAMLISEITSEFKSVNLSDVTVKDSFYEVKRAMPEVIELVLAVLAATANIVTIAMGIRNFLKKREDIKEIRLKTKSLQLVINGKMSDEDIIQLVEQAGKIVEKEK